MSAKTSLIGKVVSWGGLDASERVYGRTAGHGEILGFVTKRRIFIRTLPEPYNDEPQHSIILSINEPSLLFFDNEAEWQRWWEWLDSPSTAKPPQCGRACAATIRIRRLQKASPAAFGRTRR